MSETKSKIVVSHSNRQMAIHPSEIQARFRGFTVFALMDYKRTFILIAGGSNKYLCPIFLNNETAHLYQSKIGTKCPDMIKKTFVIETGLDQILNYVTLNNSQNIETKDLLLRFIPDPEEVKLALDIVKTSKESKTQTFLSLEGVPIFHADSLEVKSSSGGTGAIPFFFSKADIDLAISSACTHKMILDSGQVNASSILKRDIDHKEHEKTKFYKNKINEAQKQKDELSYRTEPPMIHVGCLEWVIQQMEEDKTGTWTEAVFIPPGFMKSTS